MRVLVPLLLSWLAVAPAEAADTVLYVVRHAEKAEAPKEDPALTPGGEARAAALAHVLADVALVGIHSTGTTRTRATAAPTALAKKLPVQLYDAPEVMLAKARAAGGAHLVVGHSNTIGEIVKSAGGDPGSPVTDSEFDRFYVVILPDDGKPATVRLRYGP